LGKIAGINGKRPEEMGAPNKKAPKDRGLESQTLLVPVRDAANYFFFLGAAFFLAFLVAFFID
jgi:hypothetical protein